MPLPMTPDEIVQCLIEAQRDVSYYDEIGDESRRDEAIARRDAIKAALVEVLERPWLHPCGDPQCDSPECESWRKLEEACRGKA